MLRLIRSRAQGLHFRHGITQLDRDGVRESTVDDIDDMIVILSEMIQEHRIRDESFITSHSRSLDGDGPHELVLVDQFDEAKTLLDRSFDSCSIRSDITQQFGKVSSLQYEFAERFMADSGLRLAESTR